MWALLDFLLEFAHPLTLQALPELGAKTKPPSKTASLKHVTARPSLLLVSNYASIDIDVLAGLCEFIRTFKPSFTP